MSFFAPEKIYPPAGVFSAAHFIMLAITATLVAVAIYFSRRATHAQVLRIIRILTAVLWGLEVWKILFNFSIGNVDSLNSYIPLYYCSLVLYAGAFSSLGKGWLKRVGDVFLATGNIVGGACFLLLPISSLTVYPALHFIAFHSFILHGTMTYMGVLVLMTGYCRPKKKDFLGYFILLCVICTLALIVNLTFDSNLMFISQNCPGTPLEILYEHTGVFFTPLLIIGQATLPFWGVYGILELISYIRARGAQKPTPPAQSQ